jgi:hypothetical protein
MHKSPRAYLLIEAMTAGALLAIVLTTTFGLIATARARNTYAAREADAIGLCHLQLENLGSVEALAPAAQAMTASDPALANYPGIQWSWSVTDVTSTYDAVSPAAGSITESTLWDVRVTVQYPSATGLKTYTLETIKERN